MPESKRFRLGLLDILKGLLLSVISGVITTVVQSANSGLQSIDPKTIGQVAVITGGSYLLKNVFEDKSRLNDGK